ncbi:molybdenum ABC transporter substrate-binding protein [Trinickia symbiotica]|uniref:Molybdenum ABC transporter substrate-binding protein n=1 Tax=Trinickia symbiotica TaxID=863227 RepID=A0A2T3XUI9_9BURK|nr:substrate-binding domain-containing protein [Trinickia symbiotica]PTB20190.1 molybdenum ABC transporter substrate-binding protein [Trinickia symbiotica]
MSIDAIATAPISGISSMATSQLLAELASEYERRSGLRVRIESVGGVDAARRANDGEPFDVVVLAADAIDRLSANGRIEPDGRIDVARSGIAMAVRAGQPCPEIGTTAALRETLLAAPRVGYSTGPSGRHVLALFERLGVAQAMSARLVQAPPGVPVGTLIARGEVEVGFQQLSELIRLPGITVVGPLPSGAQHMTIFSAAVCSASTRKVDAKGLLAFLASPAAAPVIRHHGMEPINS